MSLKQPFNGELNKLGVSKNTNEGEEIYIAMCLEIAVAVPMRGFFLKTSGLSSVNHKNA